MASSYIPARDSDALAYMNNFSTILAQNPGVYAASQADVDNVAYVVNQFADAYAVAVSPATRSPTTVSLKDQARATAEDLIRRYAMAIKMNTGILDADKVAIGVRPINHSRQPIPDPQTSPMLNVVGATPGAHTVRYADSMTPESGKKPYGVTALQLWVVVGEAPTEDPDTAQLYGSFTRNPIGVAFDPADDRKVATYFARWVTARGRVGPWSLPISMTIAA